MFMRKLQTPLDRILFGSLPICTWNNGQASQMYHRRSQINKIIDRIGTCSTILICFEQQLCYATVWIKEGMFVFLFSILMFFLAIGETFVTEGHRGGWPNWCECGGFLGRRCGGNCWKGGWKEDSKSMCIGYIYDLLSGFPKSSIYCKTNNTHAVVQLRDWIVHGNVVNSKAPWSLNWMLLPMTPWMSNATSIDLNRWVMLCVYRGILSKSMTCHFDYTLHIIWVFPKIMVRPNHPF